MNGYKGYQDLSTDCNRLILNYFQVFYGLGEMALIASYCRNYWFSRYLATTENESKSTNIRLITVNCGAICQTYFYHYFDVLLNLCKHFEAILQELFVTSYLLLSMVSVFRLSNK